MAYKMPSPEGTKCPWANAFYMPYSPSAYVLPNNSIHSWTLSKCSRLSGIRQRNLNVNYRIPKGNQSAVRIPKEGFLGYDDKFTSRGGKDWLIFGLIGSVFLWKVLQRTLQRGIYMILQVSKYKLTAS